MKYKSLRQPTIPMGHFTAEKANGTSTDGSDGITRQFSVATSDENDLFRTQVSYPIDVGSTCDCVTFPDEDEDDTFTYDNCSAGITWGSFQIYFSATECVDLQFNESLVYADCHSDELQSDEYVLCVIDFTQDYSSDVTSADESSSGMLDDPETNKNSEASTPNSQDEGSSIGESSSSNPSTTGSGSQPSDSGQSTSGPTDVAPSTTTSSANNPTKTTITRVLSLVVMAALLL